MSAKAPVILTTFAGRRDRMQLLLYYARAALDAGIIDEWHVWDFTRKPEDSKWLAQEFPVISHLPDKAEYRQIGVFLHNEKYGRYFETLVRAKNDFILKLHSNNAKLDEYQIVLGGWGNTQSVVRKLDGQGERSEGTELIKKNAPGLLSGAVFKTITLAHSNGELFVAVNDIILFQLPLQLPSGTVSISALSAFGADSELSQPGVAVRKQFRFLAKNDSPHPYAEYYNYYAERYHEYKDSIFIKCDDDILYFDLTKLQHFIDCRRRETQYFLLSANVLNNGICAYYQQQMGLIPKSLMELDLPPSGFGGRLWESPQWATALHEFFLQSPARFIDHNYDQKLVEWNQRLSINFIAFLGSDLVEMACNYTDDEQSLSVDIPARLDRVNAIYTPFIASHLSFYPQDKEMDVTAVIGQYENYWLSNLRK